MDFFIANFIFISLHSCYLEIYSNTAPIFADAYQDLCARLKRLEEEHGSAPVVCVRAGADPGPENYAGTEVGWASDVDSSDASGLSDEDDVAHEPKQAEHVPSPIQVEPAAPGPSTAPLAAVKHAAVAEENGETDSSLEEKGGGGSGGSGLKDTPLEEGGAEGSTGIKEPGDDDSSNERVEAPETSASEEDSRPGHGHVEENSMDAIAAREASLSQRSLSSAKSAAWEFL